MTAARRVRRAAVMSFEAALEPGGEHLVEQAAARVALDDLTGGPDAVDVGG